MNEIIMMISENGILEEILEADAADYDEAETELLCCDSVLDELEDILT